MDLISGNIFIRRGELLAGQFVETHAHNFDHTTYIPKGEVNIEKLAVTETNEDGTPSKFEVVDTVNKKATDGYNWVLIKAGVYHRIHAVTDTTYHCIYSHRDPLGEIVEDYDGWTPAYV